MNRTLIVDDACGYIRAAITEEGELCEILFEKNSERTQAESIYLGRIQAIRPSVGAAFVDIGEDINAFLPIEDGMKLRCGDMIIVQGLARQSSEHKGLRISSKINLAGKWLVLIPGESGVHVSKKVKRPELREALILIGKRLVREGFGLIIRTAGEDVTEELLEEEASSLYAQWNDIVQKAKGMIKPGLLHKREDLMMRLARDIRDLQHIVVNSETGFQSLLTAQRNQRIHQGTKIDWFKEESQLIFDAFGIEPQIDKAMKKRVWLPCGGYLIIDPCEAMTVIDVNSGKMILGRDPEDTAFCVNLEAAKETARQLRLRDISGIIVIDFIDMKEAEHRQKLLEEMKRFVQADRSQVSIEGMTRLGLMEITRKRVHAPLRKQLRASCTYCSGNGDVVSAEETALRALRQVRRMQLASQRGPFVIRCASNCVQAFANVRIPADSEPVYVLFVPGKHAERFEIEQIGAGMPLAKEAQALKYEE